MAKTQRYLLFLKNYPALDFDPTNKMNFCKGVRYALDSEDDCYYYHRFDGLELFKFPKIDENINYIIKDVEKPKSIK